MSASHHSELPEDHPLAQQLREERRLRGEFIKQVHGTKKRKWPEGRIGGDDDGELAYMVGSDPEHGIVRLEFGKAVDWLGLPPKQAIELAQSLIKHARAVSKTPLRISLT